VLDDITSTQGIYKESYWHQLTHSITQTRDQKHTQRRKLTGVRPARLFRPWAREDCRVRYAAPLFFHIKRCRVGEVERVLDTINVERIRDVGVEGIEDVWSVRDVGSGVEGGRVMGRLRTSETLSRLVQSQIWSPDV